MSYEVRLYIVAEHTWSHSPRSGDFLAAVELSGIGDGPLMKIIQESIKSQNKLKDEDKFGLFAMPTDRSKEAAKVLLEKGQKEATAEGVSIEDRAKNCSYLTRLSYDVSDGYVTEDKYGCPLAVLEVDAVIAAINQELKDENYRRYRWALALLTSIKETYTEGPVKVITYAH